MANCEKHCGCKERQTAEISPSGNENAAGPLHFCSTFQIAKMDCPAEERLIRMAFSQLSGPYHLEFDLAARKLSIFHQDEVSIFSRVLAPLQLGETLLHTERVEAIAYAKASAVAKESKMQTRVLLILLMINAVMFGIEAIVGFIAHSSGLIADSIDMFADAAVYGIALYAVGRAAQWQWQAARVAGWLQLGLAIFVLLDIGRRMLGQAEPVSGLMMVMAAVAMIANIICLLLLRPHQHHGVHMQASYIFSTNDVLLNAGVIIAGGAVWWTGQAWPDWLIGGLIATLVALSAKRIFALKPLK